MNILILVTLLMVSCTKIPKGIEAVDGFDVTRYTGTWYEIARLDNRFERGLENISATYTLRKDGGIDILNQGLDLEDGTPEKAEGKGYFIQEPNKGRLKVSFLGPFYSSYNIIALDKNRYSYAMVTGPNKSYLWILSRTRQIPKEILDRLIAQAKSQGFETDKLIFVKHQS